MVNEVSKAYRAQATFQNKVLGGLANQEVRKEIGHLLPRGVSG